MVTTWLGIVFDITFRKEDLNVIQAIFNINVCNSNAVIVNNRTQEGSHNKIQMMIKKFFQNFLVYIIILHSIKHL